jgi:hypothetical protein
MVAPPPVVQIVPEGWITQSTGPIDAQPVERVYPCTNNALDRTGADTDIKVPQTAIAEAKRPSFKWVVFII